MTVILTIFQSPFFAVGLAGVATAFVGSARMGVGEAVEEGGSGGKYEECDKDFFHGYGEEWVKIKLIIRKR